MEGQNELFWQLLEPEHDLARSFCRKLLGNREDGDDLYQDALVAALTNFSSLREREKIKAWLYRIIINKYKNLKRRRYLRFVLPLTTEISETVGNENPEPMYAARQRLETAFKVLSPDEQALVTLFEMEGWSLSELAVLTGKKENAVKVRLFRLRRKMRKELTRSLVLSGKKNRTTNLEPRESICVAGKPEKN